MGSMTRSDTCICGARLGWDSGRTLMSLALMVMTFFFLKLVAWSAFGWFSLGFLVDAMECRAGAIQVEIHFCEIFLHVNS